MNKITPIKLTPLKLTPFKLRGRSLSFLLGMSHQLGDLVRNLDCALNIQLEVSCPAHQYEGLSAVLNKVVEELDGKIANQVNFFNNEKTLTPEIVTLRIYEYLISKTQLDHLALRGNYEKQKIVEIDSENYPKVQVSRSYVFNSLHRHYNLSLGPEENAQIYRKCSNIHGHEYHLTTIAEGALSVNGKLLEDNDWDNFVQTEIVEPFHGKLLNDVIGNTSGETLLLSIEEKIGRYGGPKLSWHFRLQETHRNSFYI